MEAMTPSKQPTSTPSPTGRHIPRGFCFEHHEGRFVPAVGITIKSLVMRLDLIKSQSKIKPVVLMTDARFVKRVLPVRLQNQTILV